MYFQFEHYSNRIKPTIARNKEGSKFYRYVSGSSEDITANNMLVVKSNVYYNLLDALRGFDSKVYQFHTIIGNAINSSTPHPDDLTIISESEYKNLFKHKELI